MKTAQQQQSRETLARGPLTAARVKQNSAATSMAPLVKMGAKTILDNIDETPPTPPIVVRHSASTTQYWLGSVYSL